MIGATAASDRAAAGFGAVREVLCTSVCTCVPCEGGFYAFRAWDALARVGGGRVWHGRVRARSAVQESQRTSGGTLGGTREKRLAHGRGFFLQKMQKMRRAVVAVAASLQLGLFVALACLETHFLSLNVTTFA